MSAKRPTEAFISPQLFERGIGPVVVSRGRPGGMTEVGVFLVDVFCLGAKNGFFERVSNLEYPEFIEKVFSADDEEPRSIEPACARKLIEGAVRYAQRLGFAPHRDYKKAAKVFGGIKPEECGEEFTYGENGKPLFIAGPDESETKIRRILQQLENRCGPDGFEYIAPFEEGDLPEEYSDFEGNGDVEGGAGSDEAPSAPLSTAEHEMFLAAVREKIKQANPANPEEAQQILQEFMGRPIPEILEESGVMETPQGRARALVAEADEAESLEEAVGLARQALALDPNCLPALELLADTESDADAKEKHLCEGIAIGEKMLGPILQEAREAEEAHLWGMVEARPYLRLRHKLAMLLEASENNRRAIEQLQDILDLNDNDNQGVRYDLLRLLLLEGERDQAHALLNRFPDDAGCPFLYSAVVLAWQEAGDLAAQQKPERLLDKAIEANPFVLMLLAAPVWGDWPPPRMLTMGGPTEAHDYILHNFALWYNDSGVLEWALGRFFEKNARKKFARAMERHDREAAPYIEAIMEFHAGEEAQ